jgi:hypothetical protein
MSAGMAEKYIFLFEVSHEGKWIDRGGGGGPKI